MPNKHKKITRHLYPAFDAYSFWRASTTSQPFNFKTSKTSSASSTAPPARGILPLVWIRCSVLRPGSFGGCWSVALVEHYLWCGRAGLYKTIKGDCSRYLRWTRRTRSRYCSSAKRDTVIRERTYQWMNCIYGLFKEAAPVFRLLSFRLERRLFDG